MHIEFIDLFIKLFESVKVIVFKTLHSLTQPLDTTPALDLFLASTGVRLNTSPPLPYRLSVYDNASLQTATASLISTSQSCFLDLHIPEL